jgi:hypothetical protein
MYTIDNKEICEALDSSSRCFRCILDFGSFLIGGDSVGTITIDSGSVQNELPCIGDVVSAQSEITLTQIPENVTLEGKEFQLYIYCISTTSDTTHEQLEDCKHSLFSMLTHSQISELGDLPFVPIPMGKFTVLKCKKEENLYKLTCTDRLYFADSVYKSALNYPTTSDKVVNEICGKLGADTDLTETAAGYLKESGGAYLTDSEGRRLMFSSWQFDIAKKPEGKTMRQMLSYIGVMRGRFVVCDRNGTIVQRWYFKDGSRSLDFSADGNEDGTNCRISEYQLGESTIDLAWLVCTVDENTTISTKSAGSSSSRKMEFECPYMDYDRLKKVASEAGIRKYRPCEMTQQLGDPRLDLWDGFIYEDERLLMLNMNLTCDGGLMIDITSEGDTDTELNAIGN